ncbi:agamous-like MADS-box protein AGL23 [Lolium rigidum]|uniref:agamous-like MADS-box protein AGL23 n=1 Tax=Lolium rigidum TaxID=89674 RepID=UPI001F5CAE9B|nr:agamous-like MADS-box protein AGL23 [Lolium rigidum]
MARPPLLENGKKTKGRQRRELRRVEGKEPRQVTFSKRKAGLWKKASELALLCHARVAVVVVSEAGRAFAFGSPSADAVLGGCGGNDAPADWEAMEALCREAKQRAAEVEKEAERMSAAGNNVLELQRQTGKRFWFEVDPAALGEEELPVFVRALRRLRDNVGRRANKKQATPRSTVAVEKPYRP